MSAPSFKRSLSSSIAVELREAILSGAYPAGSQLRQDALAETFGVSRIPVREALFQLDAEGLVRITPQKGAVVSDLSVQEIRDVFELRTILEPRLLASALAASDESSFARAAEIHGRFIAATEANDVREWGKLNAEFHMALCATADLPRTAALASALLQTSDRYTRLQLNSPDAMARAVSEHGELLALCRARDVERACAALHRHIALVGEKLLAVVQRPAAAARATGERNGAQKGKSTRARP